MASTMQNFFTIIVLAVVTFVMLDIHKHDVFEKTTTAKYLNNIGATPYVRKGIDFITTSGVYKKYILPNWRSMIKLLTGYTKESMKYISVMSNWLKKNFANWLHYIELKIIPVMKEHWSHFMAYSNHYWNIATGKLYEITLQFSDWLSTNVWAKLPREDISKALGEFLNTAQKMIRSSFEYLTSQIGRLVAA